MLHRDCISLKLIATNNLVHSKKSLKFKSNNCAGCLYLEYIAKILHLDATRPPSNTVLVLHRCVVLPKKLVYKLHLFAEILG